MCAPGTGPTPQRRWHACGVRAVGDRSRTGRGRPHQEGTMANRILTAEQAAASRRRRAQHLEDAVRALLASDGWARWVRVRSRNGLSRYSWFNQVQIASQRGDATYVCGRGDWRRLGYELADSQWRRPIWILAPFTGKHSETLTGETVENGETG